jgi:hypothetical protein
MQTTNLTKQPLRLLKSIRKYHRKKRSNPLHRMQAQAITNQIKLKQQKFFEDQKQFFNDMLMRFMNKAAK